MIKRPKQKEVGVRRCYMEYGSSVVAIIPTGEIIVSMVDEKNPRHWCCFDDIETKLNLTSNAGTDQMEHAWYLARKGIISLQIVPNLCYIITAPEVKKIMPVQLENLYELIEENFSEVKQFGVDLVTEDKHIPIEINNQFEYGIEELKQIFGFDLPENHKRR